MYFCPPSAAVAQDVARLPEQGPRDLGQCFRVQALRKHGESSNVGDQDRDQLGRKQYAGGIKVLDWSGRWPGRLLLPEPQLAGSQRERIAILEKRRRGNTGTVHECAVETVQIVDVINAGFQRIYQGMIA